jgi:hypothetical protein
MLDVLAALLAAEEACVDCAVELDPLAALQAVSMQSVSRIASTDFNTRLTLILFMLLYNIFNFMAT